MKTLEKPFRHRHRQLNEDGFTLAEVVFAMLLTGIIMTIGMNSVTTTLNVLPTFNVKSTTITASSFVISHFKNYPDAVVEYVSEGCEEKIALVENLNLSAPDTVCLTVTGDASRYIITSSIPGDPSNTYSFDNFSHETLPME